MPHLSHISLSSFENTKPLKPNNPNMLSRDGYQFHHKHGKLMYVYPEPSGCSKPKQGRAAADWRKALDVLGLWAVASFSLLSSPDTAAHTPLPPTTHITSTRCNHPYDPLDPPPPPSPVPYDPPPPRWPNYIVQCVHHASRGVDLQPKTYHIYVGTPPAMTPYEPCWQQLPFGSWALWYFQY